MGTVKINLDRVLRSQSSLLHRWKRSLFLHRGMASKCKENEVEVFPANKTDPGELRIYVWGHSDMGALGDLRLKSKKNRIEKIYRPVRYNFSYTNKIVDFACGYGFSIYAVKSSYQNKLFGCGVNTDSQIGYHDPRKGHPMNVIYSLVPIRIPLKYKTKTNVIKVSAGRAHSVALTDDEGVFLFGNNAHGQCARPIVEGEDYFNKPQIQNIQNLGGERIVDVVCGQDHSMFLTETGKVYACGWGADGQTGLGHYNSEWRPTRLEGDIKDENITKISCKVDSVLALNDKGEVFGWGNCEYNQLLAPHDIQQLCVPTHVRQLKSYGKILDAATSGSASIILNENRDVFTWGYGIIGHGPNCLLAEEPKQIPYTLFGKNVFNPNVTVDKVGAGVSCLMAITDNGDLFTWGKNRCGELGLGHFNDQYFPLKVCCGIHVQKVDCGVDHAIALGKPYS